MSNVIELILRGRQDASLDAAFKSAQRDLDALAAKAKATPLTPKVEVKPVNDAKARIQDLERTLQSWQRVAARGGTIMPGDLSQIHAAKAELESLKRGLADLQGAKVTAPTVSNRGLGAVGDALQGAGLGSLASAASVAGIAALAVGAGKAVIELGQLGETVRQQRAYFEVWSGGVDKAAQNLDAMRRAVGGSLTDTEAMTGANRLLSMGLAKNADDLERMARMAVMLGGSTRTASESIEEFSLLLANQSILRLDTFGISGAKVRQMIEDLQAATPGLTREQAFLNAVRSEGAAKVDQLTAAGVTATTATQDLTTAWRGLREEIAQGVNASGVTGLLAQQLQDVTRGMRIDAGRGSIGDLQAQIESLKTTLASDLSNKPKWLQEWLLMASDLPEEIADLESKLIAAQTSAQKWGDVGVGANQRAQEALQNTGTAVDDVNSELSGSSGYWERWAAYGEAANERIRLSLGRTSDQAWALRAAQGNTPAAPTVYASNRSALEMQAQGRVRTEDIYDNLLLEEQRLADQRDKLATQNAKTFQTQYERAAEQAVNTFKGYLAQGVNASVGLLDLRQDIFKPGNNGAFENIYRALDVAKLGDASPWAAQLGLTQEQARKIGADFQRGIFSDQVMGLVDVGQLVNEAKLAELAEQTQTKFAQQIAAKAGVKTNLVSNLFGYGSTGANGAQTGAVAEQQVANAMSQVAVTLGTTVKGKDFAGQIIGYGPTIWGYFETGIVDAAKQSNALREAFEVMAQKAVGKAAGSAPGNGATGAARAGGVTP